MRCLSKEEAAAYLGIGTTLLAELGVPCLKLGRRCIYDKLDLDVWLDEYKQCERQRAGKEFEWPETTQKASTEGRIAGTGGLQELSQTANDYAKALGLKTERVRKPSWRN